jgi:hypothetical protein
MLPLFYFHTVEHEHYYPHKSIIPSILIDIILRPITLNWSPD